jgi:choline dehydrogenase
VTRASASEQRVDYVVIGSGASGAAVANRLSAAPDVTVLVLEAGPVDADERITAPGKAVQLWGSELDWRFQTEEQAALAGRRVLINQGRVVGGSTSIHALMYVRGNRRNFDAWRDGGADGWGYDDVLPFFKAVEDFDGGATAERATGGPVRVRRNPDPASRSSAFLAAATELGYDGPDWDYNGARQEDGAGLLQFSIDDGFRRVSAASAYLAPVRDRPNLTVRSSAEATRILVDAGRAIGVEYRHDGRLETVEATREVVVSAGAFLSPALLMRSGIGPADHLRAHGIEVVADLSGVGQNLQDHLQLLVAFRSTVAAPLPQLLTGNVLFVDTRDGGGAPDLQLNFTPSMPEPLATFIDLGGPSCIFLPILVQPASVGEVRLRSADPAEPPVIDPRYLSHEADVEVFRRALALIRRFVATEALGAITREELAPGADVDLDAFIRSQVSTLWHPAGTCAIGIGERSVVDSRLRVRGLSGLRVADASVMPSVTSGNTQAACFMIGEKAASMIREES